MPFFTMPYQVLFHDTMAYGSHHHVVNIELQNLARETILFASRVDGRDVWREQLKDLILLTREAYSLNLAPVALGERLAILMSYEDPTPSTVRLCFRLIRFDGQPVACGFQTMVLVDRSTGALVGPPPMLARHLVADQKESLIEPAAEPNFRNRVLDGARFQRDLFSPRIVALGTFVANQEHGQALPRILSLDFEEFPL
jgi:acyl-CoA thioesterase FadM